MNDELKLSAFQERVMSVPEENDIALLGGRGGGKSFTLALLAWRHIEQYGGRAKVLYVRRSHSGTADFEHQCRELFALVYGSAVSFNGQDGLFRFGNGGTLEINQLETPADFSKYQGRSFSLLLCDEAGQYPTPDLLDMLRSNLRAPKDVAVRVVIAANPGGPGHSFLLQRFAGKTPWVPFVEAASGHRFVHAPSTFRDNLAIDQESYLRQLSAACSSDPELFKSWSFGDWSAHVRGAYFGAVLDQSRNLVEKWPGVPAHWDEPYLAHDFGSSAPSATYIFARSPGETGPDGRFYPRDSLIVIDELATNEPGRLDRGMGYTVPTLAEQIKGLCASWQPGPHEWRYQKVPPNGVADDAIFAKHGHGAGSIAEEFRREGVYFVPARKADRLTGWATMRRLLQDAGKPDVPGLYVCRGCEYFWATVPTLGRDPRRVEDLDSRGPDHAADAIRYGCLRQARTAWVEKLIL